MSSHQSPSSSSSPLDCRPIFHQIRSYPVPPSTSSPPATLTPQKEKVLKTLKTHIRDGHWRLVIDLYSKYKEILQTANINKFNQTALHLAISDSQSDVVEKLLDIVDAHVIRDMIDHRQENPLHLAASLGQRNTCKLLVNKDPELIGAQNIDGETPLFIAARNGKKGAFYALHPKCPITGDDIKHGIRHCKRKDGNTILHVSILGEYFELAAQIIYWYPDLMTLRNHRGQTALHLLAQNPSAFKSWYDMGFVVGFFYRYLTVDFAEFEKPSDFKEERRSKVTSPIWGNCKICLDSLVTAWKKVINAIVDTAREWKGIVGNKDGGKQQLPVQSEGKDKRQAMEDPNPDNKDKKQSMYCCRDHISNLPYVGIKNRMWFCGASHRMPFLYDSGAFCRGRVVQFIIEHLLRVLGLGLIRVANIKKKKQTHTFAAQVAEILVCYASDADSRSDPLTFDKNPVTDENDHPNPPQSSEGKQRTPFLIAAKMGVLEIVQEIMDHHPMEIHQEDDDKKNALLLAVEHKHLKICKFLLKNYSYIRSMVEKVDNEGNTALHLAATLGKKQQWRISSAAIQMQWEIKWYNFVESDMPSSLLGQRNDAGDTSMEVFEETHAEILDHAVAWLNSTSQSCSVVAALIASVAYASATTVPGGDNGGNGIPILKGQPAFNIFTIASLVAMCFSITSLIMFLSIPTSNCMIQDFHYNLPAKLLVGLTFLFISTGSMFASFCAGHFFNLGDPKQHTSFSVYAIMSLPVSAYVLTQFHLFFSLMKSPF